MTWNEVRIDVAGDVTLSMPEGFTISIAKADGHESVNNHDSPEILIDGEELDVKDRHVFLGGKDHGLVAEGFLARISKAGVVIEALPPENGD